MKADGIWYQIYPQSFYDTNGDGIGDLPGVIEKLDYVRDLGCDGIWLSPFYDSPFRDAGYDVSDFCKVAPRYGTNEDARRLFEEAHARGIRVIIDLVLGHTALEHPWFQESSKPLPNALPNRYIWTNSVNEKAGGALETIRGLAVRDAGYVPNYFYHQPALNYGFARQDAPWQLPPEHPDCRETAEAIRMVMDFWLKMGADGFRVDMAHCLVKNDEDHAATIRIYQEWRDWLDREHPDAILLSEWGEPTQALTAGFDMDFLLPTKHALFNDLFRRELGWVRYEDAEAFSFFRRAGKGDAGAFFEWFLPFWDAVRGKGLLALPSGNHDSARLGYKRDPEEMKVCFAFVLTMPGVPFIYYGDEIGMDIPEGVPNVEGGYLRCGSRTPMQWSNGKNAGFSSAPPEDLYLPMDPNPERPNVETQAADGGSLLCTVRRLCRLRRENPALGVSGELEVIDTGSEAYPLVYRRTDGDASWLIALNPSARTVRCEVPLDESAEDLSLVEGTGIVCCTERSMARLEMGGASFAVMQVKSAL